MRLHRHSVLESGPYPGNQRARLALVKITGDNFAHSDIDLDSLLGLIKGCDNAKKILLELNLSSMIKSCNEMYKMQSLKIDYSNLYESIIKVMETKKVLFCAKLGFKLSI